MMLVMSKVPSAVAGGAADQPGAQQAPSTALPALPPTPSLSPWRSAHADHPLAWLIIGCALVGMLLSAADQTIVGAAMPKIIGDLNGFAQYAWVTTAYLLSVTVTMPLYGKLADLFEAKWIFLFGL